MDTNTSTNTNTNSNQNTNTNSNSARSSKPAEKKQENPKPKEDVNLDDYLCNDKTKIAVNKLEKIKNEGNAFFKINKYNEACEKYYEALNELEYLSREKNVSCIKDIEDLEDTCRLNIATCKLKTNDYELAINECLKILRKNPKNFKAHWKAGNGFINKKNYEKAYYHFDNFRKINPNQEVEQGTFNF